MTSRLRQCPFCGRHPRLVVKSPNSLIQTDVAYCDQCKFSLPIGKWNTRDSTFIVAGWRWVYKDGSYSEIFTGDGPTDAAVATAMCSNFGPVTFQKVYSKK